MIVAVTVGDMFVNIDQPLNIDLNPDFFLHFTMQGTQDRFPVLDLAAGHDPQAMKGVNATAGEEDALVGIDDTGND